MCKFVIECPICDRTEITSNSCLCPKRFEDEGRCKECTDAGYFFCKCNKLCTSKFQPRGHYARCYFVGRQGLGGVSPIESVGRATKRVKTPSDVTE